MQFKDYYDILGVKPDASADEIKSAYRRLARKFHPDVSKEKNAEDKFKEINEAYEALKDEAKRKAYDQLKARGYRPGEEFQPPPDFGGGFGGFDFNDIRGGEFSDFFEGLFGGRAGARGPARARAGEDLQASLSIPLTRAFTGGKERVSILGKTLEINIPAGIESGKAIRLAGQGKAGRNGGPNGDLRIEIQITPVDGYELDGRNILRTIELKPWQAGLGANVTVPTLSGAVELKIPPGTSSGRKFRLRGRGLPGGTPGDQIVTLQIQAPEAIEEAQRTAYQNLAKAFGDTAD